MLPRGHHAAPPPSTDQIRATPRNTAWNAATSATKVARTDLEPERVHPPQRGGERADGAMAHALNHHALLPRDEEHHPHAAEPEAMPSVGATGPGTPAARSPIAARTTAPRITQRSAGSPRGVLRVRGFAFAARPSQAPR
jgi:hypothetical protein